MASKSPVSAVSQQHKVSSTPDIAPGTVPTSPQPTSTAAAAAAAGAVPFPSPQTFDFLPPLHALILRLLSSTNTSSAATAAPAPVASQSTLGGANTSGAASQSQSQTEAGSQSQPQTQQKQSQSQPQQLQQHQQKTQLQPPPSQQVADAATPSSLPPLEAKDLFTAASAIRIRIQKARAVVENLPDIDRTTEEQEDEIEELQQRIASLKSVIADFGRRAATAQHTIEGDDRMDVGV